jgi:hypothetical protein
MPRVKLGKVEVRRRAALRSAHGATDKNIGLGGETVREALQQRTTVIAGGLQGVAGELMRFAESRAEQTWII